MPRRPKLQTIYEEGETLFRGVKALELSKEKYSAIALARPHASGSYNSVIFLDENFQVSSIEHAKYAFKRKKSQKFSVLYPPENRYEQRLDNYIRSVKIWDELNKNTFGPARVVLQDNQPIGWLSPYISGVQADELDIIQAVIKTFQDTGRIIVDPLVRGNIKKTQEGRIVIVDVGLALRPHSFVEDEHCRPRSLSDLSQNYMYKDNRLGAKLRTKHLFSYTQYLSLREPAYPEAVSHITAILVLSEFIQNRQQICMLLENQEICHQMKKLYFKKNWFNQFKGEVSWSDVKKELLKYVDHEELSKLDLRDDYSLSRELKNSKRNARGHTDSSYTAELPPSPSSNNSFFKWQNVGIALLYIFTLGTYGLLRAYFSKESAVVSTTSAASCKQRNPDDRYTAQGTKEMTPYDKQSKVHEPEFTGKGMTGAFDDKRFTLSLPTAQQSTQPPRPRHRGATTS